MGQMFSIQIRFSAKFQKQPVTVKAVQQTQAFRVPNAFAVKGYLTGKAGDFWVTNLVSGDQYSDTAQSFSRHYEPLAGQADHYITRTNPPVIVEASLPTTDVITSCDGPEITQIDGKPCVIVSQKGSKPYPMRIEYFVQAYRPLDRQGRRLFKKLIRLLTLDT